MSDSDSWRTPMWLADLLGKFDLDPCTGPGSFIQATVNITKETNGLIYPWDTADVIGDEYPLMWRPASVYCNPPYSDPSPWCARLRGHAGPWVALVKLDPTTRWWADLMMASPIWAPFKRRLRFAPPPGWDRPAMTASFPSALVWHSWIPCTELQNHLWMP
jgi:hypothetical protein